MPPTVTLLPAPLTDTSALVGVAYLMAARLGLLTAPSAMETLAAEAPFRRATGIPPNSAQERLSHTLTVIGGGAASSSMTMSKWA